ncbi:MAG: alpha/beta hydrolase fold [Frankiales bacterium]|nr:alpha/beta hydrolase fold [Frankiales bacterium]
MSAEPAEPVVPAQPALRAEATVSASSVRTVVAGDTRFLLREEGAGTDGVPVLLLHGVPETSTMWRDVAPALAASPGRRVLAPDLPGLGGSAYSGPYDVPAVVRQLAALVDAEAGGAVDVVGHDWGGSLALGLAGARPDLVRRLGVVNAPYRSVPLLRAAHIPFFALPLLPELLFRAAGRRAVDAMLSLAWKADRPLAPEVRAEYQAAYSDPARVQAMLGYYRAAARPRALRLVSRGASPAGDPSVSADAMLVLWGAEDPVLPIRTGETVVRDLGSDAVMVTVPGAGHFVVEEAPEVVLEVLRDFLAPVLAPPYASASA